MESELLTGDVSSLKICLLGAGAWGITLANLISEKGHSCVVWDIDAGKLASLTESHHFGAPLNLDLHPTLMFEPDLEKASDSADVIVSVVPSFAVRSVCNAIAATRRGLGDRLFVSCSKGIEEGALKLPSQVFAEVFGADAMQNYVVLSGPTHAEEVSRKIPTLIVAASENPSSALLTQKLFMIPELRIYTHNDVVGVEMGAAVKNVIAIAAGVCDGLGYGDNTKAALITRALTEMGRAVIAMGGTRETLSGLTGLGDLVVTTMSRHSRNRMFGQLLAEGYAPADALKEVGAVVEGYRTAHSAYDLSLRLNVEMPIVTMIYKVSYENYPLRDAALSLLTRDPKPEVY
ncbi:MAG: NAD(P)-dependent glycerol-3-phosphate dehydrogenase [Candidatus Sumerlaeales bacterium]|nr:NAD(P)-dependent glycerol-3-phosphate dehydrogenase [Candidatus Sumerlaeales bacterium]